MTSPVWDSGLLNAGSRVSFKDPMVPGAEIVVIKQVRCLLKWVYPGPLSEDLAQEARFGENSSFLRNL